MADEYDNTNRGAAFKPFDTQSMILQGKVNDDGIDRKIVLVKDQTRDGKTIIEVFEKIGVLFENDKKGNDKAPDYSGPFNEFKRIAGWKKMKDGKPYMTFNISEQQQQQQQQRPVSVDLNDDIPF